MMFYSFRNLVIAYVILIAVVLSVLLLALSNFLSQEKHLSHVNISRESLQKLELTSANFNEFVIGLNTFINTGGEQNLNFYTTGLEKLKNDSLQIIEIANSGATENKNEYRVLAGLLHEITSLASSVLKTNDTKGFDAAKADLKNGNITKISSAFKKLFGKLQADNRRVLREAYNRNTKLIRRTFIYTGIISVLLVLLLVAVARSIKKRIRAEEKLQRFNEELEKQVNEKTLDIKKSEEKYRTLIEQASDAIFINDVKGNLLDVNTNAYEMLGYTKDELRQMNLKDLYTAEELLRKPIMYEELFQGKRTSLERNMLHKDGFLIPVDITAKMLSDRRIIAIVRDITEKKKAEEALLRSKQNYSSLIDTIDGIVWEADAQTFQFSFVSKQAEKLLGYPVAQWFKDPAFWPDHIHPDDRNWAVEYCIQCTAEKKSHEFEYRMIAADGQIVWLRDIVTVIVENDKAVQLRGIMVDITEKKKAEEKIQKSEDKYRSIIEQAADGIFIANNDGFIIDANEAGCSMIGYTKEEFKRIKFEELIAHDNLRTVPVKYNELRSGNRVLNERTLIRKDGSVIQVEISAKLISGGLYQSIIRDITERKKIENELKESEERYRSVIEQASDAIFITDEKGNFIDTNSSLCNQLGYSKEELIGANVTKIIDAQHLKISPLRYDLVFAGEIVVRERKMRHKDGTIVEMEAKVKLLPDRRILVIARDVTERKKAEEALAESENYLRTIVQTEPECIKLLGINGELKDMNPAGLAMIEADSIEQVKGALVLEIVNEPYKKSFDQLTRNVFKGNSGTLEFEITGLKGTRRWLETHAVPMKNTEGKIIFLLGVTRDITERKKTAEALSNNELRFRTLTVNAPVGIFQTDAKGKTVYVNETWLEHTGMKFSEAMGDGWLQAVHPDDREMLVKEWKAKSQKGLRSSLEYRLLNKNGNIRWISGNAIPLFNQAGEITGHIGTLSDITERKNTEQIIRNSEETRKLIMNSALDAIICMDIQGHITVWTPQAEKIFGWKEQEVIGKIMADIIIPLQYREQHKNGLAHYLKTGEGPVLNRIFDITALNKKCEEFPVELSIIPIKQNHTEFFCAFIRDITERKNEEKRFRSLLDAAPDATIIVNEKGLIQMVNQQTEKLFEYSRNELIDQPIEILIPQEFFKTHILHRAAFVKHPKVRAMGAGLDLFAIKKNKMKFPVEVSISPLQTHDGVLISASIRDITDRKKAEVELEESYKAIRKLTAHLQNIREEERIHIAREIHDELGQHLTVLKMDISWLSKKINKSADDDTKAKIKDLLNIIDGTIKAVRRISAELRPSLLDDLGLVAALEWQLDEFEKRSGIKTDFKEPDEEIQLTPAVKTGLFRIFQESLTNVARHAGATKVKVSLVQTESSIELNITDNGKGFDKLKIADKRTLGLLGMRERTAMIGGTYDIISSPGKGTRVIVTIPFEMNNIMELG